MSALKMQHCLLDVLRGQTIKLIHSVSNAEFHEAYFFCAEGPCLVRLLGLGKICMIQKSHLGKYLANAINGKFISLVRFLDPKNPKKIAVIK